MEPRIEILSDKKLIGNRIKMSLVDNRTGELWRSFMPRRKEIKNNLGHDLYSLQVYESDYFSNFDPSREFVKWALIEVDNFSFIPIDMEVFNLQGGPYAVFLHKGSNKDSKMFRYIFERWLPYSDYFLDDRPHFEVLGEKYKNDDENSEEEIWIPVRPKS